MSVVCAASHERMGGTSMPYRLGGWRPVRLVLFTGISVYALYWLLLDRSLRSLDHAYNNHNE